MITSGGNLSDVTQSLKIKKENVSHYVVEGYLVRTSKIYHKVSGILSLFSSWTYRQL